MMGSAVETVDLRGTLQLAAAAACLVAMGRQASPCLRATTETGTTVYGLLPVDVALAAAVGLAAAFIIVYAFTTA
jgi:hypothetical protein